MHKSVKSYLKTGPTRQVKRNTYITLVYYDHVKTQTVFFQCPGLLAHHLHRCIFSTNYGFTILDPFNFGDSLWWRDTALIITDTSFVRFLPLPWAAYKWSKIPSLSHRRTTVLRSSLVCRLLNLGLGPLWTLSLQFFEKTNGSFAILYTLTWSIWQISATLRTGKSLTEH